jgi:uncharacterized protein (DUF488 family)
MHTAGKNRLRIFTIGHSNRTREDFLALLKEFGIETLVDIRRYPGSRKWPHFNRESLERTLKANGINYLWFETLGGRRRAEKNAKSKNSGLKSPAFRNYADYMATEEFRGAIANLLATAMASVTAIMCAEALYWRCHRKLVSDYLMLHGVELKHILAPDKLLEHTLTAGAVITETDEVIYLPEKETDWLFGKND